MIVEKSANLGPVSRVFEDKIIIDQLASEKFYHISCKNYVVRNWPEAPQLNASPLVGGCGDCAAILRGGNCWVVTIQVVGCVGTLASNLLRGILYTEE